MRLMFAETSSSNYQSVAFLVDALLARHAIFPPQREEPKERLRGRLIEVELLENVRPERKVAFSFRSVEGVSRQHTYKLYSFKNTLFANFQKNLPWKTRQNSLTFQAKTGLVSRASVMKVHVSVGKLRALSPSVLVPSRRVSNCCMESP